MSNKTIASYPQSITPEELNRRGESIYFNQLKDKLEKRNNGDYVVIEVESGDHFVNKDLMIALNKAKAKHKDKLFFIVQIGSLQKPNLSFKKEKYAWLF